MASTSAACIHTSTDFPGREVFNRSVTRNLIDPAVSVLFLKSKAQIVCSLCAVANAQSITVLNVNNFKLSSAKGVRVPRYLVTVETSHVDEYLGVGGRRIYIPLSNRESNGCAPSDCLCPDTESTVVEMAER